MDRLRDYSWPGNIRELQSVLKQAMLQTAGTVLLPASLPAELFPATEESTPRGTGLNYRPGTTLSELEREAIQQSLFQTGGNRQRTAKLLGISTRTLLRKIREYRLDDPLRSLPSVSDERRQVP